MTDLIQQEKLFVQDNVATRLTKITKNLGAIQREVTNNPKIDCWRRRYISLQFSKL